MDFCSRATGYRLLWRSTTEGAEAERLRVRSGTVTSQVVQGLRHGQSYIFTIYPLFDTKEGQATETTVAIGGIIPRVSNFRVDQRGDGDLIATWSFVPQATGYLLVWLANTEGAEAERLTLRSGTVTSQVIRGLQPGLTYTFTIQPMFGDTEGPPMETLVTVGVQKPVKSDGLGQFIRRCSLVSVLKSEASA
uniref:collagen alpha-1(XIV) chain-like n=1 Tax=Myxine glutinosa TaxID=7769 RepID=UPI00358F0F35